MYGVLKFRFHLVIIGIQESDRLLYINHVPGVFEKKERPSFCVWPEVVPSYRGQCGWRCREGDSPSVEDPGHGVQGGDRS